MKAVILAGGSGTRLWPVSRKNTPKQVQPFIDNDTLLQKTYKRIKKNFLDEDIFISANIKQYPLIKNQLFHFPEENFILEPEKKETAAAIGLSAVKLYKKDPQSIMVTVNSDAYIKNEEEYLRILSLAEKVVKEHPEQTVLIGINPTYPETGYGYIKMAAPAFRYPKEGGGYDEVFEVEKFVEKPNLETAQKYVSSWQYLWNPAVFVWNVETLLKLYSDFLPEIYEILMRIYHSLDREGEINVIKEQFAKIKPISIDYGIMEKIKKMLVIPADFGWADIGSWRAVKDVLSAEKQNIIKGKFLGFESDNNLIYEYSKNKLVAAIGLKNFVVIDTEDALLICPEDKAQDVKNIVAKLKEEGKEEYL